MSDYERWTIYPLLLLILGIVLKDKVMPPIEDSVVCRKLTFVDDGGEQSVRLSAAQHEAGGLEVFAADGKPLAIIGPHLLCRDLAVVGSAGKTALRMSATEKQTGVVEVFSADGKPLVIAGSDADGKQGALVTFAADSRPLIELAAHGRSGVIAVHDPRGTNIIGGPRGQVRFVQAQKPDGKSNPPAGDSKDEPPAGERPQEKAPPETQEEEKPAVQP